MGEKLKTTSLNSKLTGSCRKCIELAIGMEGYCVGFIAAINTKTCKWFFFLALIDTLKRPDSYCSSILNFV